MASLVDTLTKRLADIQKDIRYIEDWLNKRFFDEYQIIESKLKPQSIKDVLYIANDNWKNIVKAAFQSLSQNLPDSVYLNQIAVSFGFPEATEFFRNYFIRCRAALEPLFIEQQSKIEQLETLKREAELLKAQIMDATSAGTSYYQSATQYTMATGSNVEISKFSVWFAKYKRFVFAFGIITVGVVLYFIFKPKKQQTQTS